MNTRMEELLMQADPAADVALQAEETVEAWERFGTFVADGRDGLEGLDGQGGLEGRGVRHIAAAPETAAQTAPAAASDATVRGRGTADLSAPNAGSSDSEESASVASAAASADGLGTAATPAGAARSGEVGAHPAPRRRASRRLKWLVAAAAAAVLAVAGTMVGQTILAPQKAMAGRVQVLAAAPTGQTKAEALAALLQSAQSTPDAAGFDPRVLTNKRLSESSLPGETNTDDLTETEAFSPVSWWERTVTRLPNGDLRLADTSLGLVSARTGEVLDDMDPLTQERIKPGTVRHAEIAEAGLSEPLPGGAAALDAYVRKSARLYQATFTGNPETALFEVVGEQLVISKPGQQLSADVLKLLQKKRGLVFDGAVNDRWGQPALMFSLVGGYHPGSYPEYPEEYTYTYSFLFDPETGRLIGYECAVKGDNQGFVDGGVTSAVGIKKEAAR